MEMDLKRIVLGKTGDSGTTDGGVEKGRGRLFLWGVRGEERGGKDNNR